MKNKLQEYLKVAQNGDIMLCHSETFIAKAIRKIDKCHYHHCEVIAIKDGIVHGIGSHPGQSRVQKLEERAEEKQWDDFTILRPLEDELIIKKAVNDTIWRSAEFRKYDIPLVFGILIYQTTGIHIKSLGSSSADICSELEQRYLMSLGDKNYYPENIKRPFFTPEDVLRYADRNKYLTLFEQKLKL
jgi:hypothetical protein